MEWKPNTHTVQGLGIEPGLSGAQHQRRTTMPPASPIYTFPVVAHAHFLIHSERQNKNSSCNIINKNT